MRNWSGNTDRDGRPFDRRVERREERGGARIKGILALAVAAALVFCGIKIVPLYVNNYELQDSMQQEATFVYDPDTGRSRTADQIRQDMAKKLNELGIPADPNNIQVTDLSGKVTISLDYTIPVDLAVYQLQLHFHPQADNTSI